MYVFISDRVIVYDEVQSYVFCVSSYLRSSHGTNVIIFIVNAAFEDYNKGKFSIDSTFIKDAFIYGPDMRKQLNPDEFENIEIRQHNDRIEIILTGK